MEQDCQKDSQNDSQDASQKALDLFFEELDSGYDPLADLEADSFDKVDESGGQQGPDTRFNAQALYAAPTADLPASKRIQQLFDTLAPRRRILLGILNFLDSAKHADALHEQVTELQRHDHSVYSGYDLSLLLHEAGAIQKVNADASPFDEAAEQQPDIIEIEGIKFFKPTDGKQVFWLITSAGQDYLSADDPYGRLAELLRAEPQYQPIYRQLLEFCTREQGRRATEIADMIGNDPLLQKPWRHFSFFVKNLEDCGALIWLDKWQTTDLGAKALEVLLKEGQEQ
jgi:hypothetical protein